MSRLNGIIASALALSCVMSVSAADPRQATKDTPWENSLGMKFVPVKGTGALFCLWHTRVQDFSVFVKETGHDATASMYSLRADSVSVKARGGTWESPGFKQGPTHPVCGVNWEDAQAFCAWLTKKERADGRLTADQHYRLPTDVEWSVAVGLGSETGDTPKAKDSKINDVYPWGTQWLPPKNAGNYAGEEAKADLPGKARVISGYNDGYVHTSPVGIFAANTFGLFDMGGNLEQWCQDLYEPSQSNRVSRGSSWLEARPEYLLSSIRLPIHPSRRSDFYGFRCVLVSSTGGLGQ
ncbi:MAG: SUMF1/EgtB/PvdO family nonheme iron enzyme [bacterium]